jgi:glycosyltransferase involved in cell wall biosynthesis
LVTVLGRLRRKEYRSILCEGPIPLDWFLALLGRWTGTPVFVRRHVIFNDLKAKGLKLWIYGHLDRWAKRWSHTIYLTQDAQARDKFQAPQSTVISNGVPTDFFSFVSRKVAEPYVLGMVAQCTSTKRWDRFISTIRLLREQGLSVSGLALGDGPLFEKLRASCADLPIEWVGNQADVRPYLARMHVLMLPSEREGLSMACIEGMSTGLPLLLSDVAGAKELTQYGNGTVLSQVAEAKDYAREFQRLLVNYEETSTKSRQLVTDLFGDGVGAKQLRDLLQT